MFCGFGALNESSITEAPSIDDLIGSADGSPGQGGQPNVEGTPKKAGEKQHSHTVYATIEASENNERQTSKEFDQQRALQLQKNAFNAQVGKQITKAISYYKQLLETDFASQLSPDHPGYKIRYAALKNLTRILPSDETEEAIMFLKEAISLDATECILWWRLGKRSEDAGNYIEARRAYEGALQLNEKHWPSQIGIIISSQSSKKF